MNTFEGANQAIPMKTLVIHCLDPRAADIPMPSPSIWETRSIRERLSPTKTAPELGPRGRCSSEFHDHYHADISTLCDHDSLAIMDFEQSLKYDIGLLRKSPAVPKHIKLWFFLRDSGKLTEVVRDIPAEHAA
jgi:carbonic anhydrase